jgi:hypothetical protein
MLQGEMLVLSHEEIEEERLGKLGAALFVALFGVLYLAWSGSRVTSSGFGGAEFLTASQQARVETAMLQLRAQSLTRAGAYKKIADMPPRALLGYLSTFARSGSTDSRRAAIAMLLEVPPPTARDALLEAALRTGCPDRQQVLEHAARMDRAGTILRLVQLLEPEGPMSKRVHAAFALGSLRAVEAFTTLVRISQDQDEVPFLRRASLTALGSLKTQGLEGVLLQLLDDPDETFVGQVRDLLRKNYLHLPKVWEALRAKGEEEIVGGQSPPRSLTQWIRRYARKHRLDPALVSAVIQVESDFQRRALSASGAQGLMQLMPETAAELGVEDPFDGRQNIAGGTRYLRRMLDRFGSVEFALAAYNAGPTAVDRYDGIPPYPETQRYVRKVMKAYRRFRRR